MTMLPNFIDRIEKADNGMEAIQDFFLRWAIRCSADEFNKDENIVHEFSKKIVLGMIFGENGLVVPEDSFDGEILGFSWPANYSASQIIISAEANRQEKYIDLVGKVLIKEKDGTTQYLLNIEDKYYHKIEIEQLIRASKYVNDNYRNEYEIRNILIVPDHTKINNTIIDQCREIGYKIIAIPQLQRISGIDSANPTGNYLFDSFWFVAYGPK